MLAVTSAALAPALGEMQASDLVHPEPHESKGPVFRFRHALIQEAISLALLRAERRDLHARAARALEARTSGRHAEVAAILGRHYAAAEIADRALYYLELAGDHATNSFANDEAIASFREALAVAEHAGADMASDAVRLHAKLANVLWRTAHRGEARDAYRAALRLADAGPRPLDPLQRAQLELALAMNYERSGQLATVFSPGSPIRTQEVREILLRNLAGPALLRQQAKASDATEEERDTALFTLLYKDLMRGHYRDFGTDMALLPDPLPEKPSVPWDRSLTLFHWDYPYDLYCKGGWLNPDSPDWFADYTRIIVDRLSDRVAHWMTLNEPQCFIGLGLENGQHAPGDKLGLREILRAGHNALLAHGKGVQAIRAHSKQPSRVGYAPVGVSHIPATDSEADISATRQAMFSVMDRSLWNNTWWLDPVFLGRYPEDGLTAYGAEAPQPKAGDLETISQPLDFFGCNVYNGGTVRAGADGKPETVEHPTGMARTTYGWPVTPSCLYWAPKFFRERYGKPIIITENGLANTDWVALDGKVHDPQRIDILQRHLREFERAHADGRVVELVPREHDGVAVCALCQHEGACEVACLRHAQLRDVEQRAQANALVVARAAHLAPG